MPLKPTPADRVVGSRRFGRILRRGGPGHLYTKATSVIFGIYALQMILIPANMVSLLDRPSRTTTDSSIGPPSRRTTHRDVTHTH